MLSHALFIFGKASLRFFDIKTHNPLQRSDMKHFDIDFSSTKACVYRGEFEGYGGFLRPIVEFQCVEAAHLVGISEIITALRGNTQSFLDNAGASNVLLWGARGCGKSSSMRAVLCEFLHSSDTLRVVEIPKPSLAILPHLVDFLRTQPYKFVIMCDDLCFGRGDESYKALKSILDGGFEAQARNILFYATSNIRHLLLEEYAQDTMHLSDMQDELISLSDRFGIALGFYTLGSGEYANLIAHYLGIESGALEPTLRQRALNYATQKGSKNPRIAKEFVKLYQNGLLS